MRFIYSAQGRLYKASPEPRELPAWDERRKGALQSASNPISPISNLLKAPSCVLCVSEKRSMKKTTETVAELLDRSAKLRAKTKDLLIEARNANDDAETLKHKAKKLNAEIEKLSHHK
jgi:hypothetical protein